MHRPRLRGLLFAACLPLLFAACGSETPSIATAPGAVTTVSANGVQLTLDSGGGQSGLPGQPLAAPIVVRVLDARGRPMADRQVVFGPGATADADPQMARTDAEGYARTVWTLGPERGPQTLRVSGTGGTLLVTATGQPGSGASIALVKRKGDEQTAAAGRLLPVAIQAAVVRDNGAMVAGAPVTYTASSGGRVDVATARTTVRGTTQVRWTLGPHGGTQTLTAITPGAQPVVFTATATGGRQPRAATLRVQPDSLVLDAGASAPLAAVIRDDAGAQIPGLAPAWTSSDAAVATVDSAGRVTAMGAGSATITASLGALSASATVRVRGGPATIQLVPDSLVLEVGATGRIAAVLRDAAGAVLPGPAPTWTSSAPGVAAVDAEGEVRGVSAGTARVTATVGALSASATVRVRGARGPSLELFPDSLVLDIGVWGKLYPVARDASGNAVLDYTLQWSTSSDQVVFPFSDGSMLPIAAGTARITVRWGNLTASVPVRVRPARASLTIPQIQKRKMTDGYGDYTDPSRGPQTLNFWIHTSVRNVSTVSMRVRSPSGRTIDCANVAAEHYSYDEFRCQVYLPRGSEPGVWRVDRVTVTKDGQTTTFTSADLDAHGTLGRGFDVFGTGPDTQPPRVSMLWPHQGTRYPDIYYLDIGIIDHVSGVRGARMTVRGPGGVTHSCVVSKSYGELARVGGGVCRLPLRPGSGTWELVSVEVEDGAGNRATYTPQQIAEMASGLSEAPFFVYSFTP
jgi:hypothetical protein